MSIVVEIVIPVICLVIAVWMFIAAVLGKDLVTFERLKTTAPRQYRSLKWLGRLNGPMVAVTCIVAIPFVPSFAFAPDGGLLPAIGTFLYLAIFLWLSVRWFLWSLRE